MKAKLIKYLKAGCKLPARKLLFMIKSAVVAGLLAFSTNPLLAQAVDADPPVLEYQAAEVGVIGEDQLFLISATDNVGLASVTFAYRLSAASDYVRLPMQQQGETDTYMLTLSPQDLGEGAEIIQYFFVAVDDAGNRSLEGFAFSPLERQLVSASQLASSGAQGSGPIQSFNNLSTGRKVLYGALGVLVVGALISASDSGGTNAPAGTTVTLVSDPLPTE